MYLLPTPKRDDPNSSMFQCMEEDVPTCRHYFVFNIYKVLRMIVGDTEDINSDNP
jgi:hypothetical protein